MHPASHPHPGPTPATLTSHPDAWPHTCIRPHTCTPGLTPAPLASHLHPASHPDARPQHPHPQPHTRTLASHPWGSSESPLASESPNAWMKPQRVSEGRGSHFCSKLRWIETRGAWRVGQKVPDCRHTSRVRRTSNRPLFQYLLCTGNGAAPAPTSYHLAIEQTPRRVARGAGTNHSGLPGRSFRLQDGACLGPRAGVWVLVPDLVHACMLSCSVVSDSF